MTAGAAHDREVRERLAWAERLLAELYWQDWTPAREAEVRRFLGVPDDGPRRVPP